MMMMMMMMMMTMMMIITATTDRRTKFCTEWESRIYGLYSELSVDPVALCCCVHVVLRSDVKWSEVKWSEADVSENLK
jgi:hypothetical protein